MRQKDEFRLRRCIFDSVAIVYSPEINNHASGVKLKEKE
jgi:hypothetical protein